MKSETKSSSSWLKQKYSATAQTWSTRPLNVKDPGGSQLRHTLNKYLRECIAIEGSDYPLSVLQVLAPSDSAIASQLAESTNSVHVTSDFNTLLIILFFQSILLQMLVCCCCCSGRTSAQHYDKMFVVYVFLFLFSIGTYIWTMSTRFSHAGHVCSGDFL